MVALVENNMAAIRDFCKKHHVKSLYLIGSATTDSFFNSESDVDFLYRFNKDEIVEMDYADNYFDLLFSLQELLNRKVDLVAEEKLRNPYFIESINLTRTLIYKC
jgi:predicted nucleotidyltransferase